MSVASSVISHRMRERGFVLITSLIMLSILTLLSLAMFFASRTSTQVSSSAQSSTEAYYYAETAINYISWALANDAEFDQFPYTGTYIHGAFTPPPTPASASSVGDLSEWGGYMWNPGPYVNNSDSGDGVSGQVMYFDNSPMDSRYICFEDATIFSNCVDVNEADPANRVSPTMHQIHVNLPRYIKLEIAVDGTITPSIPQLPHRAATSVADRIGEDIPNNGAIVWITAGDASNPDRDIEIFPLDPGSVYAAGVPSIRPSECLGGTMPASGTTLNATHCPCDYDGTHGGTPINTATDVACEVHALGDATSVAAMGNWVSSYSIVAYAIGYVNGKAKHLIRSVIR